MQSLITTNYLDQNLKYIRLQSKRMNINFLFSEMAVIIAYPNSAASTYLGTQCISNLFNLAYYMPKQVDVLFGKHMIQDLQVIAARSGDTTVEQTENCDFSLPDVEAVIFPCLGNYLIVLKMTFPEDYGNTFSFDITNHHFLLKKLI